MTRLVGLGACIALAIATACSGLFEPEVTHWSPQFSPDGTTIAFVRIDGERMSVMLMDSDGSNQRELSGAHAEDATFAWAADGRLAYTDYRDEYGQTCWSPPPSVLCYASAEIYVRSSDGRRTRRVTWDRARDTGPGWTDGGKRIVFWSTRDCTTPGLDPSSPIYAEDRLLLCADPQRRYVVAATGRGSEVVYRGPPTRDWLPGEYGDPSGRVFATGKDRNGETCVDDSDGPRCEWHGELYLRRPGKQPRRLTRTTADERYPSLSPDGKTIVFTLDGQVTTMRIDGSEVRILTSS